MQQQAQAQQAQGTDPNQAFLAAEQMKAQTQMQSDMAKLQLEQQKMAMEDDRSVTRWIKICWLMQLRCWASMAHNVDVAAIKAAQQAARG